MLFNRKILWAFFFLTPLLVVNIFGSEPDDYEPEITVPVSRISYLTGDVKIHRANGDDWERAVLNLPVIEGDEIATGSDALLEIQFDRDNYLRLAQNSYLKILNLRDEGAALGLSQGILSVRILKFDKDKKYFEIDAPNTTVAVRREGMYRVDAGDRDSREVRVSVTEEGEARVYSVNSGFTLKNGRSARIFLEGHLAGESEVADAFNFYDEFDEWSLKRDALIAKRLKDAYFDQYYDRDIYGAEDLNDYGEWIYTRDYGYVWRPFRNSINSYDNWSPYRYGHWRWIPAFGWTWVNDEPWGWATYHHGRWIYHNGYWAWTPYGYYRPRRSWWSPALVVVVNVGNNICWYPLPHRARYYGYNNRSRRNGNNASPNTSNSNPPAVSPTPSPTRDPSLAALIRDKRAGFPDVPATAVISVPVSDFGRNTKGFRTAPTDVARTVLAKDPGATDETPFLPNYRDLNGRVSREIRAEKPPAAKIEPDTRIGAAKRLDDAPLDRELRQKQIYGNRTPVEPRTDTEINNNAGGSVEPVERRRTGAVNRPMAAQKNDIADEPPLRSSPQQPVFPSRSNTRKSDDSDKQSPTVIAPPTRREEIRQPKREEPRNEPPPPRIEPRSEPAPRRETPKSEPPPERRVEPKSESPRRESPPQKNEPKDEPKSSGIRPNNKDN